MATPVVPLAPKTQTVFGVSKSTIQGYLSMAAIGFLMLSQAQLPSAVATPTATHYWVWITWAAAGISGFLKLILARTQGDATN